MAISTYSELQAEIAAWLQRADLATQIPSFVELATSDFNATLRVPQMEILASTTVTAEWTELPDGFLAIRHIETGDGKRLTFKTPELFAAFVATEAQPTIPIYTVADMSFRMYPAPTSLDVELLYYSAIPELVNSSDTNWLLTQFPGAYLAASLAWGFKFLQDPAGAAGWDAETKRQMAIVTRSSRALTEGASAMAIRVA